MTGLLVLLAGVLFGGLQSGVLAQDGGKISYSRALERLELLVASLNESLHETKEDLWEVRLCLNQTKKVLGEVQGESEVLRKKNSRLETQLAETRSELAATKALHQLAINELRANQDSSRVEALEGGLKQVKRQVGSLETGLGRVRKEISGLVQRQILPLKGNISVLESEVGRVENEMCEKIQNVSSNFGIARKSTEEGITGIKQVLARSGAMAAVQQRSIDRLTTQVTRQGQSVNQLSDSVTDQEERLDKLTRTVEKQGTCIARLKDDVQKVKMGKIADCYDAMLRGANESGVYTIHPINANKSFNVYCDMETDGGGWTVLLKRQDGTVNFYRNWTDYKRGFGNLDGEHWLGLDNMYLLTHQSSDPPQLRVDLADWEGNTAFANYGQFSVGDEDSDYTLSVSGYQNDSTAGDALTYNGGFGPHNGQRLSTPDRDRDRAPSFDCVVYYHAPWWHNACYDSILTGKYFTSPSRSSPPHGIIWHSWKGRFYSLHVADMKIRPGGV